MTAWEHSFFQGTEVFLLLPLSARLILGFQGDIKFFYQWGLFAILAVGILPRIDPREGLTYLLFCALASVLLAFARPGAKAFRSTRFEVWLAILYATGCVVVVRDFLSDSGFPLFVDATTISGTLLGSALLGALRSEGVWLRSEGRGTPERWAVMALSLVAALAGCLLVWLPNQQAVAFLLWLVSHLLLGYGAVLNRASSENESS